MTLSAFAVIQWNPHLVPAIVSGQKRDENNPTIIALVLLHEKKIKTMDSLEL